MGQASVVLVMSWVFLQLTPIKKTKGCPIQSLQSQRHHMSSLLFSCYIMLLLCRCKSSIWLIVSITNRFRDIYSFSLSIQFQLSIKEIHMLFGVTRRHNNVTSHPSWQEVVLGWQLNSCGSQHQQNTVEIYVYLLELGHFWWIATLQVGRKVFKACNWWIVISCCILIDVKSCKHGWA